LSENRNSDLADYRANRAKECLAEAEVLLQSGHFAGSVNRSYYAIFNSLRAILALRGVDFKKHSGVISYFQKEFVKTGFFAMKISDYVQEAFALRQEGDYQDYAVVSRQDAKIQLKQAGTVFDAAKKYLARDGQIEPSTRSPA
jgi:uncharacterized protein (UPF0332 family)